MARSKKSSAFFLILGHISAGLLAYSGGVFQALSLKEVFHLLADGFFVPGVFFSGIGLLALIARDGQFDGLAYTLYIIREKFVFLRRDDKTADFGEFRSRQKRRKEPVWPILVPGLYFLAVSVIFIILFGRQP